MNDYVNNVASILGQAQFRLDGVADNIANMTTPAFRRGVSYRDVAQTVQANGADQNNTARDLKIGSVRETGASTDLALLSDGFFVVQTPHGLGLTRAGAFSRDADGRFVSPEGYVLQLAGGGDLVASSNARIFEDGAVMDGDQPIGRIWTAKLGSTAGAATMAGGVFVPTEDSSLAASNERMRQGALEMSNVSTTAEMIEMMSSLRQAETGQKLMNVYDDLLNRAFSVLGGQ